jgi:hypothetical protein
MFNREIYAVQRRLKTELEKYADDPRRMYIASNVVRAVAQAIKECNPKFDDEQFLENLLGKYERATW